MNINEWLDFATFQWSQGYSKCVWISTGIMKFNGLACSQENGVTRSMIDVFIHKSSPVKTGVGLRFQKCKFKQNDNLVASTPRKHCCPSSSIDFQFVGSVAFILKNCSVTV